MASTTPQQGRRWLSRHSTQSDGASSSQPQQTSPEAPITSSDTQPRFLNNPQSTEAASSSSQASVPAPTLPSSQNPSSTKEPRTCWICQQDDTEDTPENNIWRTPCPCSLTAHDSCLLQWIANEEAPKPGEMAQKRKIVCPQCQAEIKIQRPKDYLVSVVDSVLWAAKRLMLPAAAGATVGVAYSGLLVYGMNAMTLVFGAEETKNILTEGFANDTEDIARLKRGFRTFLQVLVPFFPASESTNTTLFFAVPLIGPALVLLRTRWADQTFPVLLLFYFIKPSHRSISWPPSPGLTLATIPYIRTFYNELYRHTFSSLEKKWELAVQRKPREGETAEQIAAAARAEAEEDDGHAIFELEWVEEEVDMPAAGEAVPAEAAQPDTNFVIDGAENEGVGPQPNPPRGNANGAHNHNNNNNNNPGVVAQHDIDIPTLASTVFGALFFPAISSLMGSLLKYTLPTSLTSAPRSIFGSAIVGRGLLKEKWGRSIVGGCLFVVLKDAVVLYCKWKKARDFGKRKVLDFVGERGKSAS